MRIGVDLGGTKIEAIMLVDDGRIATRLRMPTPQGDYAGTLAAIGTLIQQTEGEAGPARSVGICTPGSVSPVTGLMQNCNSTCLNGQDLKADLEALLLRDVRLANDADCLALSEAKSGAGTGYQNVFGVILGTGVGGGLVIDGKLIRGPNGLTGEWGHTPLSDPMPNRECYCGRSGCVETWISGPAIEAEFHALSGHHENLANIAKSRAPIATQTIDHFLNRLAKALGTVVNTLDPDCIVFGGGVSNIRAIYDTLPERISQFCMTEQCLTAFKQSEHGDSSGVRGAAWLWP